jgi:hypothetical protein
MSTEPPNRVFLGNYEGGLNHLIVPREAWTQAEAKLDAERERREAERMQREALAASARLQAVQDARIRGRLRKLTRALFRGHRRIPQ